MTDWDEERKIWHEMNHKQKKALWSYMAERDAFKNSNLYPKVEKAAQKQWPDRESADLFGWFFVSYVAMLLACVALSNGSGRQKMGWCWACGYKAYGHLEVLDLISNISLASLFFSAGVENDLRI